MIHPSPLTIHGCPLRSSFTLFMNRIRTDVSSSTRMRLILLAIAKRYGADYQSAWRQIGHCLALLQLNPVAGKAGLWFSYGRRVFTSHHPNTEVWRKCEELKLNHRRSIRHLDLRIQFREQSIMAPMSRPVTKI